MSTKNRATGDTENEFQAALVTYTKAGNKTAAMRRLWNAAYEMGKSAGDDAVFEGRAVKEKTSDRVKEARLLGLDEGRKEGFVEGWQASEKAASTLPAFQLSFAAGRIEGLAAGTELGRETEGRRWTDGGHLDNGTCRARDESQNIAALTVSPAPLPPHLDHARTPGAFSWADDADSLPIHTILVTPPQPRDFSVLRSGSRNPFDTLHRRHARHHGNHTGRKRRRPPFYSTHETGLFSPLKQNPSPRSPTNHSDFVALRIVAWVWALFYGPMRGHVSSGQVLGAR
ncbi:hypothetical protein B0H10DRAFT_2077250 [Mycena sp. CBHHK59/15]|nr:hypothetical protein B0H10DRAFT_2141766 [Mycena sp. CBHHK59/15]KAJ6586624.1 hypothetical protein B0H10DRAFT_2094897 [Mycena sp. CBHHK59/15]KAJ6605010.1 hypothetical protein B0H10DRAFT_2077250 [Mycena sp. CBHHK59/15]